MVTLITKLHLNKWTILLCSLLVGLLINASAYAQNISVAPSIDPQEGEQSDYFQFTVTILGARGGGTPYLNPNQDFKTSYIGPSSQVSIVNGTISTSVAHNYELIPQKTGELHTPDGYVTIDGRRFEFPSLLVKIRAGNEAVTGAPDNRSVFLKQTLSREWVYRGEQVVNRLELYTSVDLAQPNLTDDTLDGFWQEDIGKEQNERKIVNGVNYQIVAIKRALFPLRAGELTIPPREVTAKIAERNQRRNPFPSDPFDPGFFGNFFGAQSFRTIALKSEPATLTVRELPKLPQNSQLWGMSNPVVGETQVEIEFNDDPVQVGGSKPIVVTVTSLGNLNPLKSTGIKNTDQFRAYEETPKYQSFENNGQMVTKKSVRISIVPLKPGEITIPPFSLTYFNPSDGEFKVAQSTPLTFTVSGELPNTSPNLPITSETPPEKVEPSLDSVDSSITIPSPAPTFETESYVEGLKRSFSVSSLIFGLTGVSLAVVALFLIRPKKSARKRHIQSLRDINTIGELEKEFRAFCCQELGLSTDATSQQIKGAATLTISDLEVRGILLHLIDSFDEWRYGGGEVSPDETGVIKELMRELALSKWG